MEERFNPRENRPDDVRPMETAPEHVNFAHHGYEAEFPSRWYTQEKVRPTKERISRRILLIGGALSAHISWALE